MAPLKNKKLRKYAALHTIFYFMVSVPFMALFPILGLLCYLIVRPFSEQLYVKLLIYAQSSSTRNMLYMYEVMSTFDMHLYIEKDVHENYLGKESAICVQNHIYGLDFVYPQTIMTTLNKMHILQYFIKVNNLYLPIYGQNCCLQNIIPLKRSFEKDVHRIKRYMEKMATSQETFMVLLYAEGTRFTEEKQKASVQFARERGLKLYKYHLLPRTKGFTTIVPILRKKIKALYDLEVLEGGHTSISNLFNGTHSDIHIYLRRIPIDEVPTSTESLENYLYDMYTRKDEMIDTFRNSREEFAASYLENYIKVPIKSNRKTLWQLIVQAIIFLPIYFYYFYRCIYVGDTIGIIMCVAYASIGGAVLKIFSNHV